mmetsp:Transcript_10044/g.16913  ORF Transcript_10044/g.16913 Transcript_10044/m.16913 type:complete len:239 (-) Transcript_10044:491-1207(-)
MQSVEPFIAEAVAELLKEGGFVAVIDPGVELLDHVGGVLAVEEDGGEEADEQLDHLQVAPNVGDGLPHAEVLGLPDVEVEHEELEVEEAGLDGGLDDLLVAEGGEVERVLIDLEVDLGPQVLEEGLLVLPLVQVPELHQVRLHHLRQQVAALPARDQLLHLEDAVVQVVETEAGEGLVGLLVGAEVNLELGDFEFFVLAGKGLQVDREAQLLQDRVEAAGQLEVVPVAAERELEDDAA